MGNCGRSLLECSHYVDAIKVPSFQFEDLDFVGVRELTRKGGNGVDIAQGWLNMLSTNCSSVYFR